MKIFEVFFKAEVIKVVILDEADFLTIQAQASLRNVIETFSRTTRFILTCNFVERIIDPLQSRCHVLKIVPPSKKEVAVHLSWILDEEKIVYEVNDLGSIVNQYGISVSSTTIGINSKSYLPSIYFETGSGANYPVSSHLIKAVNDVIDVPMIVGGGIRTPEVAAELVHSGASIIVTGTVIEDDASRMKEFSDAIHCRK